MATAIKAIYRGSVTYAAADGVAPAAIAIGGTIDPAKSIVSITTRDSDGAGRAYRHFFHYDITTTTIAFTRAASSYATSVTLEWEIIEFSTGVTVQRGNANFTSGTTLDIPITAVTLGQAFSTTTAFSLPGSNNSIPVHYSDLTSTTNLRITQYNAINATFSWQVIEFDTDVTIQNGLSSSTGGASRTSRTVAITAVDTARSFILNRGQTPPPSYGTGRETQTIGFNSGFQLQIDSLNWGTIVDNTTAWTVVELPVGSVVQSGSVTILNGSATPATQPSWTGALANGSSLNAYAYHQNRKTQQADNTIGGYQFSVSMDVGKTSLTVQRDLTSNDHVVNWFAIDWPQAVGGGSTPYTGVLGIPTTLLTSSSFQLVTQIDYTASFSVASVNMTVLPFSYLAGTDYVVNLGSPVLLLSSLNLNIQTNADYSGNFSPSVITATSYNLSLQTNTDYTGVLSNPALTLTQNNLTLQSNVDYIATLSKPSISQIVPTISYTALSGFLATLSVPALPMTALPMSLDAQVDFIAALGIPAIGVVTNNMDIVSLVDYVASLGARVITINNTPLDVLALQDYFGGLVNPQIAISANDIDLSTYTTFVGSLAVSALTITGLPFDIIAVSLVSPGSINKRIILRAAERQLFVGPMGRVITAEAANRMTIY